MNNFYDYDYNKEKENLDMDIQAQQRALEDLVQKQNAEDQRIKDEYDSIGARSTRFLEALGAGLRGENASNVVRSQRQDLANQLANNVNRFKGERDSAYGRVKDLLTRRENLNNTAYNRERDLVKDQQAEKDYQLKDRQVRNQERQTDFAIGQGKQKENELLQSINDQQKLKAEEKAFIENDINNLLSNLNPKDILPTRDSEVISSARINDLNLKIAKNKYDKEGKDAISFINDNPNLFLNDKDSKDILRGKLGILGYNLPEDKVVVDERKKVDAEYIKKLDRISKDPTKTNKLLSKYNNDPKAAYRAWMNKPKIFDTLD